MNTGHETQMITSRSSVEMLGLSLRDDDCSAATDLLATVH
jgi:hypothetical protein